MSRRFRSKSVSYLLLAILVLVLCIGAVCATSRPTAYAEESVPQITIESKTVHRGQAFTVDVNLSNNDSGLIGLLLTLTYDHEAMKLVDAEFGSGLSTLSRDIQNTDITGFDVASLNFLWSGIATDKSNGKLLTLYFESKISAEAGLYNIQMVNDPKNTKKEYGVSTTVNITNGVIDLQKGQYTALYLDWDDTEVFKKEYNDGETPEAPAARTRASDDMYSYVFDSWKPIPYSVAGDSTVYVAYRADYAKTAQTYDVFYYVDGLVGDPDGKYDLVNEFYNTRVCDYDQLIVLSDVPAKKDYTFMGWYTDPDCKNKLTSPKMPAKNMSLYGFFKYNIRATDYPQIRLQTVSVVDMKGTVEVYMENNFGITAMSLTLSYNHEELALTGFERASELDEMQFSTSNPEHLTSDAFKFFWDGSENCYDTGLILTMTFDILKNEPGLYDVTFTYDPSMDVTYQNDEGETWYSMVDVTGCSVPYGNRDTWEEPISGTDVVVKVVSEDGKPIETKLVVEIISAEGICDEESVEEVTGDSKAILGSYNLSLMKDGIEIDNESNLIVRIGLTDEQKKSPNLTLYRVGDDGKLTSYEFTIEGGEIVFTTKDLGNWVIVGQLLVKEVIVEKIVNEVTGIFHSPCIYIICALAVLCVLLLLILIISKAKGGEDKGDKPAKAPKSSGPKKDSNGMYMPQQNYADSTTELIVNNDSTYIS